MKPAMGTYFSKNCSVPASAPSVFVENTNMTVTSSSVNKRAPSVPREYDCDYDHTPTNEKVKMKVDQTNYFVNENCMLSKVKIERLQYSTTKFNTLSGKTEKQSIKSEDYLNKIVDVTKLLAQLMNAKVVLRKLEEPPTKYAISRGFQTNIDDKKDVAGGTNYNDHATRYCALCKKTKYARIRDPSVKNCSDCKTAMTYLCTKCNEKHYKRYPFLLSHLDRCEGSSNVDDALTDDIDRMEVDMKSKSTDETKLFLDRTQFIVKEFQSDDSTEKSRRYCPACKIETANQNDRRCTCGEIFIFKCTKCHVTCNSTQGLKYHLDSQCYPTAEYQCTHCEYSRTCWQKMQKHFKIMHTNVALKKCMFCTYETKWRGNLQAHIKSMHEQSCKKFHCSSCSFSTKYERSLRRHQQQYH